MCIHVLKQNKITFDSRWLISSIEFWFLCTTWLKFYLLCWQKMITLKMSASLLMSLDKIKIYDLINRNRKLLLRWCHTLHGCAHAPIRPSYPRITAGRVVSIAVLFLFVFWEVSFSTFLFCYPHLMVKWIKGVRRNRCTEILKEIFHPGYYTVSLVDTTFT